MPELITTEITQKEFDNIIIPINHVLCEQYYESEGMTTKSGIILGVLTELTYQDPDNPKDDSSHVADFAETSLRVVKVPKMLYFDIEDSHSMPWQTQIEIESGDLVWTNPIDALNAITVICSGRTYKVIPYQDLYVAKRTFQRGHLNIHSFDQVICLNGYCLLKQIHKSSISELDVTSEDIIDKTIGEIAYVGSCNSQYQNPNYYDFQDLQKGDVVLFDRKTTPFLLERQKFSSQFDRENLYWVVQRRGIAMVLNRK